MPINGRNKGANEVWKDVPKYKDKYQVSDMGRVRWHPSYLRTPQTVSRNPSRYLNFTIAPNGYHNVSLYHKNGFREGPGIHRVVMLAFVGKAPKGCNINHIDKDKSNNKLRNLEYITHRANSTHSLSYNKISQREVADNLSLVLNATSGAIRQQLRLGYTAEQVEEYYGTRA